MSIQQQSIYVFPQRVLTESGLSTSTRPPSTIRPGCPMADGRAVASAVLAADRPVTTSSSRPRRLPGWSNEDEARLRSGSQWIRTNNTPLRPRLSLVNMGHWIGFSLDIPALFILALLVSLEFCYSRRLGSKTVLRLWENTFLLSFCQ